MEHELSVIPDCPDNSLKLELVCYGCQKYEDCFPRKKKEAEAVGRMPTCSITSKLCDPDSKYCGHRDRLFENTENHTCTEIMMKEPEGR